MMEFIFRTLPKIVNGWFLEPLMTYVFGPTMSIILPSGVKEHFTASPQRILSFLFLIIVLNGIAGFVMSLLARLPLNIPSPITNCYYRLKSYLSYLSLKGIIGAINGAGFSDGYNDGLNERPDALDNYKMPFLARVKRVLIWLVCVFVGLEVMLAIIIEM